MSKSRQIVKKVPIIETSDVKNRNENANEAGENSKGYEPNESEIEKTKTSEKIKETNEKINIF